MHCKLFTISVALEINEMIRILILGNNLDVFKKEPVSKDFYKKVDNSINCIITPHIAGVTQESNIRVSNFIAKKLIKFFR